MIQGPQDVVELRERHPGGVQQEKLMFLLWVCDTLLTFYGKHNGNVFIMI